MHPLKYHMTCQHLFIDLGLTFPITFFVLIQRACFMLKSLDPPLEKNTVIATVESTVLVFPYNSTCLLLLVYKLILNCTMVQVSRFFAFII